MQPKRSVQISKYKDDPVAAQALANVSLDGDRQASVRKDCLRALYHVDKKTMALVWDQLDLETFPEKERTRLRRNRDSFLKSYTRIKTRKRKRRGRK